MQESEQPEPVSAFEERKRAKRVGKLARRLGFRGHAEYRHVYSRSGGAQYCTGPSVDDDLLVVYAEAFDRDANLEDFSLEALVAHECGHQHLRRNPSLAPIVSKFSGDFFEEILASLIGSLLLDESVTAQTLVWKATAELGELRMTAAATIDLVERLRQLLRRLL